MLNSPFVCILFHTESTVAASTTAASSPPAPPPVSWKHWTSVVDSWLQPQLCPLLFMSSSSILFLQSLQMIKISKIPIYQSMMCVLARIKFEYRPHFSHQIPTFCWKTVASDINVDTDIYQQHKATRGTAANREHTTLWPWCAPMAVRYRSYNRIVTEMVCKMVWWRSHSRTPFFVQLFWQQTQNCGWLVCVCSVLSADILWFIGDNIPFKQTNCLLKLLNISHGVYNSATKHFGKKNVSGGIRHKLCCMTDRQRQKGY